MSAAVAFVERWLPGLVARYWETRTRALAAARLYDAAKSSDYRPRRGSGASGDAVMQHAGSRLRDAARYYDENYDFAVAVLDELANAVVGDGLYIEPMVRRRDGSPDQAVNEQLRVLWDAYWERPDVTGEVPGTELERLVVRSTFRDGEVFGIHHTGGAAPFPTAVPYVLEVLEADYCPMDMLGSLEGTVHGIEKNAWNRPTGYWFYLTHPGHSHAARGASLAEVKRVPAARVMHPKITRRLNQTRGVTILHPVLNRIDDIKDGEESERIAMRVAAAFCAIITQPNLPASASRTADGHKSFKMAPGTIFQGGPGDHVEVIDSKRPNTGLADFLRWNLRAVAAGVGARFSAIARDYGGTYSSQRQELVEAKMHTRRWLEYFVATFYRPVRSQFISAAVLNGNLRLSPDTDRATLLAAEYRGPSIPWIQPEQEMKGFALAVENQFMSRAQVIRDLGGDPEQVAQQIAEEGPLPRRPSADPSPTPEADDDEEAA